MKRKLALYATVALRCRIGLRVLANLTQSQKLFYITEWRSSSRKELKNIGLIGVRIKVGALSPAFAIDSHFPFIPFKSCNIWLYTSRVFIALFWICLYVVDGMFFLNFIEGCKPCLRSTYIFFYCTEPASMAMEH